MQGGKKHTLVWSVTIYPKCQAAEMSPALIEIICSTTVFPSWEHERIYRRDMDKIHTFLPYGGKYQPVLA